MAHFARIDIHTNIVLQVHAVDNSNAQTELEGINFLLNVYRNKPWASEVYFVQTSYNSNIRYNFAGIGFTYDKKKNAFIPAKPYPSWTLNPLCFWEAPISFPADGKKYLWDEQLGNWIEASEI